MTEQTDTTQGGAEPGAELKLPVEAVVAQLMQNQSFIDGMVIIFLSNPGFVDGVRMNVLQGMLDFASDEKVLERLAGGLKIGEAKAEMADPVDYAPAIRSTLQDMLASGELLDFAEASRKAQAERDQAERAADAAEGEKIRAKQRKALEAAEAKAAKEAQARIAAAIADYAEAKAFAAGSDEEELGELRRGWMPGTLLRFAEDGRFLPDMPPIIIEPAQLQLSQGRATLEREVEFTPDMPGTRATEAWLIADDVAIVCEIPAGLVVGGGKHAKIPAGHLAF